VGGPKWGRYQAEGGGRRFALYRSHQSAVCICRRLLGGHVMLRGRVISSALVICWLDDEALFAPLLVLSSTCG